MSPTSRRRLLCSAALVIGAGCSSAPPVDRPTGTVDLPRQGTVLRGVASWYGPKFDGRPTASGEIFHMDKKTAAHRSLPFGTRLRVTNLDNGRAVEVRVNDRGPFVDGRILDLSRGAARELRMIETGVSEVEIRILRVPEEAVASGSGALRVQAGAFRDPARARAVVAELEPEFPGIEVYSGEGWHRVQIRDLTSREQARTLSRRLRARGFDAVVLSP